MEVREIKKSRGERGGGAGGRKKKRIKKRWKRGSQELRKKNIFKESAAKHAVTL